MEAHTSELTSNVEDARPTIAILGAGIGGLALAIGLLKRNVSCTVYEAAPEFSAVGAGIGLGPNALRAMDLIDPRFRMKYDEVKTGNERPEFENCIFDALYAEDGLGEQRGWTRGIVGAPYFTRSSAHRKDLLTIMESLIPCGIVQFSKRVVEIQQNGGLVTVRFEDGESITSGTVIGCDGVKGISRQAVLEKIAPELIPPEYTGTYIYRGILPMEDCKSILGHHGGDAKWFMAKDKGVVIYPISKGREANFVFFVAGSAPLEQESNAIECSKKDMIADLGGFDSRLMKLLDWAQPFRWPVYHIHNTPTYFNGRLCLLGDVAHACTPYQAAGAGQGLEDAAVLAELLSCVISADQLNAAFQVYDAVRRPRATKVVQTSYEAGMMYQFRDAYIEDDMQKIVDNANQRLHWIWQHDIQREIEVAKYKFRELLDTQVV